MSFGENQSPITSKVFDDSVYYRINWLGNDMLNVPSIVENTNSASLEDESKSNVKVCLSADVLFNETNFLQTLVHDEDSLWITTANNEKYYCKLPKMVQQPQQEKITKNNVDKINPYQLLKPLISREVCSYRLESYWTYELCHGRYIRQFHEESTVQKVHSQEYYLGKYDLSLLPLTELEFESKMKELVKEGKKRPTIQVDGVQLPFIEINMTGGTLCDLNNKPRFTRVFYVCNEDSKHELYSIKEIFTCEYEAIVLSPLLCLHSDFRVSTASELDINCYAVGKSPPKPKGIAQFEAESRENRFESLFDRNNNYNIIIGKSDIGKEFKIEFQFQEDPKMDAKPNIELTETSNKFAPDSMMLRTFLKGDLCLHGGTGWWKYKFCYGEKVEQYHEERPGQKTTILLGKWDVDNHIKWMKQNPKKLKNSDKTPKQVSHLYSGGDICDTTGKPRQVEVKLKCRYIKGNPESVALYLREPKPCDYILDVESPLVCHLLSTADENGLLYHPDDVNPL
ncbi:Endoplasmic reticulum lectin 1-like protein [Dinothrombium tinctorium]|uniref:Endoplasmic reticulum lectin 1 n=1 Tax=Dinothrombium tinctorium TaxID=1965070 RepID=A0A3S3P692_9ACAR|nr:Endoplasmic reticulum lectin 1-like protein [Dinothrombium tinctorium]